MNKIEVDRDKLQTLELEVQDCEGNVEAAKEDLKREKERLDKALTALRNYVREVVSPTRLPLLDDDLRGCPPGENVDPMTGEIFS